jgi:ribosomal protein L11
VTAGILLGEIKEYLNENKQFNKKSVSLINVKRIVEIAELRMQDDFMENKCKI